MLNPVFDSDLMLSKVKKMCGKLDDECTLMFKDKLNVIQRKFLVGEISNFHNSTYLFPILMKFFFKNQIKMKEFWTQLDIQKSYGK
jgi:hypothetical protein